METTLNNGITYTYNREEMIEKINATIQKIEKVIKLNEYQVIGNIENYKNLPNVHLTKTQMKKIQKYCHWVNSKPTSLRRINMFFHLLSKFFGTEKVYVKVSAKEESIQKARKEWLKAKDEADRLLKIYKEEKGDYYKNKTNFFLKK